MVSVIWDGPPSGCLVSVECRPSIRGPSDVDEDYIVAVSNSIMRVDSGIRSAGSKAPGCSFVGGRFITASVMISIDRHTDGAEEGRPGISSAFSA